MADEERPDEERPDDTGELTKNEALSKVSIDEAVPRKLVAHIISQVSQHFSGPIPPPEVLRQYNEIVPNGAERIFKAFERQTEHRLQLENFVAHSDVKRSWWGLILGFVIAMTTVTGGCLVAAFVSPTAGATIATAAVATLAAAFIYGTNVRSHERQARLKELAKLPPVAPKSD